MAKNDEVAHSFQLFMGAHGGQVADPMIKAVKAMSIEQNLREMELSREAYWLRYPGTSPFKLRRRALTVRHCLHVLPGERILELGAGSGL